MKAGGNTADPPEARDLLSKLGSKDRIQRLQAAWWLGERCDAGPDPQVRKALASALRDADADVRGTAAEALGRLGGRDEVAVHLLLPFLEREQDPTVRARTVYGIGRAGSRAALAVPTLLGLARSDTTHCYDTAVWALGEIGVAAEDVVPVLAAGLRKPHSDQRWVAAKALGRFGPAAAAAAGALCVAVRDGHPFVCEMAAWALGETGAVPREAVAPLRQLARSRLPGLRREALVGLRSVLPNPSGGVEELAEKASAPVPRQTARPSPAVLLRRLQKEPPSSAADAAFRLGELAGEARGTVPTLLHLLDHPSLELRRAVVGALGKIAALAPNAAEALAARVARAPDELLVALDWAVGLAGPTAAAAIPALKWQLQAFSGVAHLDLEVRYHAAWALARLTGERGQVVPDLVRCLEDPDSDVRAIAAENLGFLFAEEACDALRGSLEDPHVIVRHRASWALARIARGKRDSVDRSCEALGDERRSAGGADTLSSRQ